MSDLNDALLVRAIADRHEAIERAKRAEAALAGLRAALDAYVADHPDWLAPGEDGCDTSLALRAALNPKEDADARSHPL